MRPDAEFYRIVYENWTFAKREALRVESWPMIGHKEHKGWL